MEHILRSHEMVKSDMVRGSGSYLYDNDNRRYIDFEAGVWCTALGHNHPEITQTIQKQLDQIMHINFRYTNTIAEEAAVMLLDTVSLPEGKCIFLNSGSEVVEFNVQITRHLSGKPLLLRLSDAYMAAYGLAGKKERDQWVVFDWQECITCDTQDTCNPDCKRLSAIPFEEIGGFVFEPGSTSGLVKFPPKSLVEHLAKSVQDHSGFLVVDEVTTGIGRTGKWYGYQHYDVDPDLIAVGKGLGNGYPVSAAIMSPSIADKLENQGFRYIQSHQNDPLGCAIAKAVLSIIEKEALIERSREMGKWFVNQLEMLKEKHAVIKEIRGRGLMISIEFQDGNEQVNVESIYRKLLESGLLVGYHPRGKAIRFYPALIIEKNHIMELTENLSAVLENYASHSNAYG